MKQLPCNPLKSGDILLKVSDGSLTSKVINLGQRLLGKENPEIVHAGVLINNHMMVEAQGSGVSVNSLLRENRQYAYYVFRCSDDAVGEGAGSCASLLFEAHSTQESGYLPYSISKAALSLFGDPYRSLSQLLLDDFWGKLFKKIDQGLFCSQLVVLIYQLVLAQFDLWNKPTAVRFDLDAAKTPPGELARFLCRSDSKFFEAGWLAPGERGFYYLGDSRYWLLFDPSDAPRYDPSDAPRIRIV